LQPINPDGNSLFSQKRAVSVKFHLSGDPATGFEVGTWKLRREAQQCGTENWTPEGVDSATTSSSTALRYDATTDQYIATATLSGTSVDKCYRFVVEFDDGTSLASAKLKVARYQRQGEQHLGQGVSTTTGRHLLLFARPSAIP
jgi:hypothetical protein